jgi:hypothetical protein
LVYAEEKPPVSMRGGMASAMEADTRRVPKGSDEPIDG